MGLEGAAVGDEVVRTNEDGVAGGTEMHVCIALAIVGVFVSIAY